MLQSPSGPSWLKVSQLEILISRACEPTLHEPNYALHLEVADYVNKKKANTPREAAMTIARLANHRNPHIAILSLALLDTLVQSCGYPFHLQISTKEFLNELVRRFPERPPPFPGPVMSRILELIHGWKEGMCSDSRWKEDLGNIRDMHRLLTFKGYRFRDIPRANNAAVSATANLKTAEELEEEDRAAQSAKLQELIRRGTPRDLAAAQELMKSLAGANPDAKPDYRSQALTELNKLEQKVILLNEMLDNVDRERGEKFVTGDAYDQVSSILTAARPKLQKWISDAESDDPESLDTFLQINDQINSTLGRYEAFKKGDYTAAALPIPQDGSAGAGRSLIDFDDVEPHGPAASNNGSGGGSTVDDLSDLFGSSASVQPQGRPSQGWGATGFAQTQQPAFGGTMGSTGFQSQQQQNQSQPFAPTPIFANGGSQSSMTPQQNFVQTGTAAIRLGTPGSQRSTPAPSHGAGGSMGTVQLPNYFSNSPPTGPSKGVVGGSGMGGVMGSSPYGGSPSPPTMGGMSALGGLSGIPGFGQQQPQQQQQFGFGSAAMQPQQPRQQQSTTSTATTTGNGQPAKDPFADLAGLF
ncbi:VHS domain-containing protein [Crepidotus variabilis]|uniref:VHS domain-containing protein n=1 Tax=Crepidotus variabilis TaxID=179855 RepID=A0A9P6EKE9_9AGAR|nr:VHS domain-containing protein [Crepidotus variabilis]